MGKEDKVFLERLERHHDELRWLYMELYDNDSMFAELSDNLRQFYLARNKELKKSDEKRAANAGWYKQNELLYHQKSDTRACQFYHKRGRTRKRSGNRL